MIEEKDCARLAGHSVVTCICMQPGKFLPCPPDAIGVMTATYPPSAYVVEEKVQAAIKQPVYSGGYTGSICDVCGSPRMRRSGTCETCDDCGSAGGCG